MVKRLALLTFSACAAFAQPPVVTEILNNYSLTNPGTVAQGAIFIVKGTNLSDFTTGLQDVPLQTALQGVRIVLTVQGVTTFAPLYYVLPQQLAGILPSNTPEGTGTLSIRNNGKNSTAVPITVVRSAFGVLTASGAGTGSARVQDANQGYQELVSTRSTNPGNFLVFYGSGVGPVTGDETIAQVQTNLTGIPITVTIGGRPATVFYRGRTVFPGLDQINVQVPVLDAGAYGCAVPVVITTNNFPANTTTIPVAQSGPNCAVSGGSGSGPTPQEIDAWISAGSFTSGTVSLTRTTFHAVADALPGVTAGTTITRTDGFDASFNRISGPDLGRYLRGDGAAPAIGACQVSPAGSAPSVTFSALDAGPSVTASGPGTVQTATRSGTVYRALVPGPYLNTGRYTISGSGGPAVSAFSGGLDVAGEFTVVNPEDLRTIVRGAGATVRWAGGDPTIPVRIAGTSVPILPDGSKGTAVSFVCLANNADGRFTVPPSILLDLPASGSFDGAGFSVLLRGSFSVTAEGKGTRITASGLDFFSANNSWTVSVTTNYR